MTFKAEVNISGIRVACCFNCGNVHMVVHDDDGDEVGEASFTPDEADMLADAFKSVAAEARKHGMMPPARGRA